MSFNWRFFSSIVLVHWFNALFKSQKQTHQSHAQYASKWYNWQVIYKCNYTYYLLTQTHVWSHLNFQVFFSNGIHRWQQFAIVGFFLLLSFFKKKSPEKCNFKWFEKFVIFKVLFINNSLFSLWRRKGQTFIHSVHRHRCPNSQLNQPAHRFNIVKSLRSSFCFL